MADDMEDPRQPRKPGYDRTIPEVRIFGAGKRLPYAVNDEGDEYPIYPKITYPVYSSPPVRDPVHRRVDDQANFLTMSRRQEEEVGIMDNIRPDYRATKNQKKRKVFRADKSEVSPIVDDPFPLNMLDGEGGLVDQQPAPEEGALELDMYDPFFGTGIEEKPDIQKTAGVMGAALPGVDAAWGYRTKGCGCGGCAAKGARKAMRVAHEDDNSSLPGVFWRETRARPPNYQGSKDIPAIPVTQNVNNYTWTTWVPESQILDPWIKRNMDRDWDAPVTVLQGSKKSGCKSKAWKCGNIGTTQGTLYKVEAGTIRDREARSELPAWQAYQMRVGWSRPDSFDTQTKIISEDNIQSPSFQAVLQAVTRGKMKAPGAGYPFQPLPESEYVYGNTFPIHDKVTMM